jgi:dipeptidyl aminopeptidase/acylaminoacyl peptidase
MSLQISPDGERLSYIAPVDGVLNVWVGPADDLTAAKPVTQDTYRGIRIYTWAYTGEDIIYLQDSDGDENYHAYRVSLTSDEIIDLSPYEGVRAEIQGVSHRLPGKVALGMNDRDPSYHDLYLVDIASGERELLLRNEDFAGVQCDDDLRPRLAVKFTDAAEMEIYRLQEEDGAELLETLAAEETMTTAPVAFDKSGRKVYLLDGRGRDTAALFLWDLESGDKELLAEDDRTDIDDLMLHPTENTLQAYAVNFLKTEWHLVDTDLSTDWGVLRAACDGEINVTSRTTDLSKWTVAYLADDGPVRYYLYDRQARRAEFLFTNRPDLEGWDLASMHPVVIKSRDGLELVSYLSLPPGTDPEGAGRPRDPLPMVLWVHGGPWARDDWGFSAWHQLMANRGYAVLSVNYRGSTGFGKEFINAANGEWAGKMHDDLIDAVEWAVSEGIALRDKVAIGGGSYGGYATLVGMTFTPDTFACGVDIVGPSSLLTLLQNVPEYWMPMLPSLRSRVGDFTTEEGIQLLVDRSPLSHVERIRRPLLIAQGANDPRVKQAESDQIVESMREKGIPVTYILFPDEGHGFARPENQIAFVSVAEGFLAQHLGGRAEPIGEAFDGSKIECPEGAEGVEGLGSALEG